MSLRRTTSAVVSVLALAAVGSAPAAAAAHGRSTSFHRLSTFPVYLNSSIGDTAAAEISTVTEDGRTVVYTDSPGRRIGFVDITNPSGPQGLGTLAMGGEPTSVAHLGHLLLAGVNTSSSKETPTGKLVVVDDRTHAVVRELDLGGQPDSVAVAPSGRYVAVAIENERDEDVEPRRGRHEDLDGRQGRLDRPGRGRPGRPGAGVRQHQLPRRGRRLAAGEQPPRRRVPADRQGDPALRRGHGHRDRRRHPRRRPDRADRVDHREARAGRRHLAERRPVRHRQRG